MLDRRNKTVSANEHLSPADSFVVDLRRFADNSPAPEAARSGGKKHFSSSIFKSLFAFKRREKKARPHFSGPSFRIEALFTKDKRRFKFRNWSFIFWNRRHYRNFFRPKPLWELPFNRRRRRSFSSAAALSWRHLRSIGKEMEDKILGESDLSSAKELVSWYRSIFAFIIALIFIVLPFKILAYFKILDFHNLQANVVSRSLSAINNLAAASEGASQLNLGAAASNFSRAERDFSSAERELSQINDLVFTFASFSNNPKIKLASSGKKFLAAGKAAASMGRHLSEAGDILLKPDNDKNWGVLIDSFVENGRQALADALDLQSQLEAIDVDSLPEEYRPQFLSFRNQAAMASASLSTLLNSAQEIKDFLGVSRDKRYLLVFQNNAEMRGSGGFFGSYALVDIRDGRIRRLEVPAGGSYDTEAGMKNFIKSPKPLWLVSPRWYFWDANWWPDWPTSARSLMWFYEKSGGPTVDGVISFTPDVLADLLKITGPIDMQADYGLTVDADNFWDLIQATVEKDNLIKTHPQEVSHLPDSPKNQPKKIIGDLMAKIVDRLPQILSAKNVSPLIQILEKNLSAKNIMLYFSDKSLEEKASRYGFDGAILPSRQDYLLVAHANIAGQKSDRKISERIEHSVQVLSDLSLVDTVTITRTHNGLKNEILSGVRNVDWLRVYVPQGSQLLEASGFRVPDASYFEEPDPAWEDMPFLAQAENRALIDLNSGTKIYTESGKTVFANWTMLDPGETAVIKFRYRLPFKLQPENIDFGGDWLYRLGSLLDKAPGERFAFSLLWQKQPGAKPADVYFRIDTPAGWRQIWNYPDNGGWQGAAVLDRDLLRAALLEK